MSRNRIVAVLMLIATAAMIGVGLLTGSDVRTAIPASPAPSISTVADGHENRLVAVEQGQAADHALLIRMSQQLERVARWVERQETLEGSRGAEVVRTTR